MTNVLKKSFSHTDLDDIIKDSEDSIRFYETLQNFIIQHSEFKYVCGLNAYKGVSGTYVIALSGTNSFIIGYSDDIYETINMTSLSDCELFHFAKLFICPDVDCIRDIKELFPSNMVFNNLKEIGGVNMNKAELKEYVDGIDKRKVAIAAGGLLALAGAISLVKFLVGKHHD